MAPAFVEADFARSQGGREERRNGRVREPFPEPERGPERATIQGRSEAENDPSLVGLCSLCLIAREGVAVLDELVGKQQQQKSEQSATSSKPESPENAKEAEAKSE